MRNFSAIRNVLLVAVFVLVSGCIKGEAQVAPQREIAAKPQVAHQPGPTATGINSDCYTVDLFTRAKIEEPAQDVPQEMRQFLGRWGGGAWNDFWCHDLVVTSVDADGRVELVEMLAPHEPWKYPATAFRRSARIDDQGNLRFAYARERLSYRIANGKLVGTRSGRYGNLRVVLVRRGVPPIPIPRPIRLVRLTATGLPGN